MVDEYSESPRDDSDERFSKLELHVVEISCNMTILIVDIESKFGSFKGFGGSNSESRSDGKSRDIEDPKKEPKRDIEERPSSNNNTFSRSLFKVEAKVDIKPHKYEIYVVNLNPCL